MMETRDSTLRYLRRVSLLEAYMQAHPGTVIPMPSGQGIFQSLGLWEDYSTPNRDLRLLIHE